MTFYTSFDKIVKHIAGLSSPGLIAIDGLPCSGKSTLTERLQHTLGLACLELDDFALPQRQWPMSIKPNFPFEYMRYQEFVSAVKNLQAKGEVSFYPFDWDAMRNSPQPATIKLDKHVIVEGTSSFNEELAPLYALRIFVDSDFPLHFNHALRAEKGIGPKNGKNYLCPVQNYI